MNEGGYLIPIHQSSFMALMMTLGRGKQQHWDAVETVFRFMRGIRYAA